MRSGGYLLLIAARNTRHLFISKQIRRTRTRRDTLKERSKSKHANDKIKLPTRVK